MYAFTSVFVCEKYCTKSMRAQKKKLRTYSFNLKVTVSGISVIKRQVLLSLIILSSVSVTYKLHVLYFCSFTFQQLLGLISVIFNKLCHQSLIFRVTIKYHFYSCPYNNVIVQCYRFKIPL